VDKSLEYNNLVIIANRILNGFIPIHTSRFIGKVRDAYVWEAAQWQIQYEEDYREGLDRGLLGDKEAIRKATERGEWQEDWSIETTEKQIKLINDNIKLNQFKENIVGILLKQRQEKAKELDTLKKAYNALMLKGTAKYHALKNMVISKVEACTTLEWGTLCTESDFYEINSIIDKNELSIKIIRAIARSGFWAVKYRAAKDGIGFLIPDLNNITSYQESILSWTQIYDSAYNSMNPPTRMVIENDDEFDMWLEREHTKREFEKSKKGGKHNHKEIFISTDKKGAEKVYNMNDKVARTAIQKKLENTTRKGKLDETEPLV